MKIDTFIRLIQDMHHNQITDDTDPNNTVLQQYTNPFDTLTVGSESIHVLVPRNLVWSDGTTYTAYDNNGNPYQAPSCGWLWGTGGRWG